MATVPEIDARLPAERPGFFGKLAEVRHSWVAVVGVCLVVFWVVIALIAPFAAPL